jgi:uncharacterized protein with ParB-like and HNH nuclease domain
MKCGFEKPITIREAIEKIVSKDYLLPAIQRKFVWDSEQIEILFDSIMQDYPINSFMLWDIKEKKIKSEFKFYDFLTKYRERFNENNPDLDTKDHKDFFAVIDGQQRLTSIYIGLKGSYAYKLPRKWWKNDEDNIPTRKLYVNLLKELPANNDRQMKYDFCFLTKSEYKKLSLESDSFWFQVGDILNYKDSNDLDDYIEAQSWKQDKFAKHTIRKLRSKIFEEPLINYYCETT